VTTTHEADELREADLVVPSLQEIDLHPGTLIARPLR
jgi:hypothetical protein